MNNHFNFRNVIYNKAHAEKLQDTLARNFWPIIGTANQTAFSVILEAVDAMEDWTHYKHQVKHSAKKAVEKYNEYQRHAYNHYRGIGDNRYFLWQDMINISATNLRPHIEDIFNSFRAAIERVEKKDSGILALIQTAYTLTDIAVGQYDALVSHFQSHTFYDISSCFAEGRITGVHTRWREVADITSRLVPSVVNLNKDKDCHDAVGALISEYETLDFIEEAARKAIILNPAYSEYLKEDKPNDTEE